MFGSMLEREVQTDDDAGVNAEKVRKLFDLPEAENIITGS